MASAVQGFEVILENFHWKMKKKQKQKNVKQHKNGQIHSDIIKMEASSSKITYLRWIVCSWCKFFVIKATSLHDDIRVPDRSNSDTTKSS